MNEIQHTILEADRAGFRLEFLNGLGVWEASPILRHHRYERYETKDLQICVPFYRNAGLKDIVVFDGETNTVLHYQEGATTPQTYQSPVTLTLQCGCVCTV